MYCVHHHLCKKSRFYRRWHQHPLHPHVHWGLFGAVVLGVALSFVILGWKEQGASIIPAQAQTTSFDQRRQDYFSNPGTDSQSAIWAWFQNNDQSKANEIHALIQEWLGNNEELNNLGGWIGWGVPRVFLARILYQFPERIQASDRTAIERRFSDSVGTRNGEDIWNCGTTNSMISRIIAAYIYLQNHKEVQVTYPDMPDYCGSHAIFLTGFTVGGRRYDVGGRYNGYEITRDWLYRMFEQWVATGDWTGELDGNRYTHLPILSLYTLYDLTQDHEMKRRAKMTLELLLLDSSLDVSTNSAHESIHGGSTERIYGNEFLSKTSPCIYRYQLWGAFCGGRSNISFESDIFVSSYRLPAVIEDIGDTSDEGKDYYHINTELHTYGSSRGKWTYVTKHYSLGGGGYNGWTGNMLARDDPSGSGIRFWIDELSTIPGPGGGEYYVQTGKNGYQYKNAILVKVENGILHFAEPGRNDAVGNTFDVDETSGGWRFLREDDDGGTVAMAIKMGTNEQAIEMAQIGLDYTSYEAFKNAVINRASLSGGVFTTSKGDRISIDYTSTIVNGQKVFPDGTPDNGQRALRLQTVDNTGSKIVTWSGNIMTVQKGGRTCNYDFGNWTTNGNGCGGTSTPPPKTCTTQTCTTSAGCAGTCSADQTYCIDVSSDNCPAGVGSCGVPGANCSLDSCLGKCDSSGNTCVKTDPSCGGEGICPTTCISMGGDTCSDSLKNATELTACSTAYCAPNYAPKSYCVKCNPGSTLNPATDRCEAGSTQNQPPRNLVLRYLGPTPTGGQQCTPACGGWSQPTNQCGSRTCTRTDCSTYSDTKTCGGDGGERAFPGCEGFGCETPGGRGGKVVFVTNLNDSGPGSLRAALMMTEPRIIVFKVSGTIYLNSPLKLTEVNSYVTVAGQTAPGDGIAIALHSVNGLEFEGTHDVVFRYLRIRGGERTVMPYDGAYNIIFDHNSFTWSTDQTINTWGSNVHDITWSWNIVAEGGGGGGQNAGSLFAGSSHYNIMLHHNYLAHQAFRNYKVDTGTYDFINNVNYNTINWDYHFQGASFNAPDVINHYFKKGPDSRSNSPAFDLLGSGDIDLYLSGNKYVDINENPVYDVNDQPSMAAARDLGGTPTFTINERGPHTVKPRFPVTKQSADEGKDLVLSNAGARLPKLDAVDTRLLGDFFDRGGYDPNNIGKFPNLKTYNVPQDNDNDGMPDDWEVAHGLNPNNGTDHNKDRDGDGYTNIEEWINSI